MSEQSNTEQSDSHLVATLRRVIEYLKVGGPQGALNARLDAENALRLVNDASGWRVWSKQGGWEWDAWYGGRALVGAARNEVQAKAKATAALADLRGLRS